MLKSVCFVRFSDVRPRHILISEPSAKKTDNAA